MPSVFITGISGFIGRAIAEEAVREGYDVSGIDLHGSEIAGVTVTKADMRDSKAMLRLTQGVDYVMNIAAITSNLEFEKRMGFCYDVNVNGFISVIEAARINGCKKFLYASSSAIYQDRFSEDVAIDTNRMDNHYAKTKVINEIIANSYRSAGLLDAVGMRFFNVYGPGENAKGDYASIVSLFLRSKAEGKALTVFGDGNQRRDLVYVDDIARVAMKLLKKGRDNVYNVGTGAATSYRDIAGMVGGKVKYVKNPLSTYQLLTKADTTRLFRAIGKYRFMTVAQGLSQMVD